MKKIVLGLGVVLLVVTVTPSVVHAAPAKKKNAVEFLKDARDGIAVIGKALKTANVDPKAKNSAPFLKAVKRSNAAFAELDKAAKAKSKDFSKGTAKAYEASKVLQITFSRSGLKSPDAKKGVAAVVDAAGELFQNYSAGAARKKKGGKLTAKEKLQFDKVKASQKEFAGKLGKLRAKLATDKGADPALVKTVSKMERDSARIQKSGSSVDDFVDALALVAYLSGIFDGWTYYVPASYNMYWVEVFPMTSSWDVMYYETYDVMSVGTTWDYYEYQVDVSSDYSTVDISSSEVSSYDSYVETLEVGSYEEVSVEDVGDYGDVKVESEESGYLEDEVESDAIEDDQEGESAEHDATEDDNGLDVSEHEESKGDHAEDDSEADADNADDKSEHDAADTHEEAGEPAAAGGDDHDDSNDATGADDHADNNEAAGDSDAGDAGGD